MRESEKSCELRGKFHLFFPLRACREWIRNRKSGQKGKKSSALQNLQISANKMSKMRFKKVFLFEKLQF